MAHTIKVVRVYEWDDSLAGHKFLVDRLWPRGVSRDSLEPFNWAKELTPSPELRKWFGHDPEKYPEFKERYLTELEKNPDLPNFIKTLKEHEQDPVIMLYGAKDETHNQAVVLSEFLKNK